MHRIHRLSRVSLIPAGLVASATGVLATLGFAGPALATGSTTPACGPKPLLPCTHLAVMGPVAAAAGVSFPLYARGYANQKVDPANKVYGWNTPVPCKGTYAQEVGAAGPEASSYTSDVKGRFSETYTVGAGTVTLPASSNQSTWYWCAYLVNAKKATVRHASWTYTVLGHGGGPGGPGGAP